MSPVMDASQTRSVGATWRAKRCVRTVDAEMPVSPVMAESSSSHSDWPGSQTGLLCAFSFRSYTLPARLAAGGSFVSSKRGWQAAVKCQAFCDADHKRALP